MSSIELVSSDHQQLHYCTQYTIIVILNTFLPKPQAPIATTYLVLNVPSSINPYNTSLYHLILVLNRIIHRCHHCSHLWSSDTSSCLHPTLQQRRVHLLHFTEHRRQYLATTIPHWDSSIARNCKSPSILKNRNRSPSLLFRTIQGRILE